VHLQGKDVYLARLLTDLTQHIRKPGQDVKKYAVFNKPDVVAALRGWVAAEGDFEACERGVWLRDELNGLIHNLVFLIYINRWAAPVTQETLLT